MTAHKTRLLLALALVFGLAGGAQAGPDEAQRHLIQRAMAAKQKLKQAQAAKGPQRDAMMSEHMRMMQEMIEQMRSAKPAAGISPKEHEEWMAEHQKLMAEMMDQMMGEHQMMTEHGKGQPPAKGPGAEHQH